ncbi:MAG: hypothetical protein M0030_13150 [Actinomycetota bacterium]|nr:hypothetical protein [Actinomycetota bacterium]
MPRPLRAPGAAAGLFCIGSAIAVGAGTGGLSFFTAWMNRYQPYAIAVTLLLLLSWLGRTLRAMSAGHGDGPPWRRLARGQAGACPRGRVPGQLRPLARAHHGHIRRPCARCRRGLCE